MLVVLNEVRLCWNIFRPVMDAETVSAVGPLIELARAIHLDPSQIAGLGPSLDALLAMLLERKRKILAKYETESVQGTARKEYHKAAGKIEPPPTGADASISNQPIISLVDMISTSPCDQERRAR